MEESPLMCPGSFRVLAGGGGVNSSKKTKTKWTDFTEFFRICKGDSAPKALPWTHYWSHLMLFNKDFLFIHSMPFTYNQDYF